MARTRILTIPGRTAEQRRERLARVQGWMAARGWRLADYAEEAGSALFERPSDAPRLGWLDGTRWFPGPRPWRPGQWLPSLRAEPRLAVLPAAALLAALLLAAAWSGVGRFGSSAFDPARLRQETAAGGWFVVTSTQLNVRDGPDERRQAVGLLYRGQRVRVEGGVDGEWVRISIPDRGYVAKAYLAPAEAPPQD